jgi:hypothetical protein
LEDVVDKSSVLKLLSQEGFAERRFSSGEFISAVVALAAAGPLFGHVDPETIAKALSALSTAYVVSRSLLKINRQGLRASSLKSSEFFAHLLAGQAPVASMAFLGAIPAKLAFILLMANSAVFIVCRGIVKAQAIFKLHQQRIGL